MKGGFKLFITVAAVVVVFLSYLFVQNQKEQISLLEEQTRIQREAHILNIFAEYQANINSCRQEALTQKKDEEFIQANCIEVINSSMIGDLLTEWGRSDLLITK